MTGTHRPGVIPRHLTESWFPSCPLCHSSSGLFTLERPQFNAYVSILVVSTLAWPRNSGTVRISYPFSHKVRCEMVPERLRCPLHDLVRTQPTVIERLGGGQEKTYPGTSRASPSERRGVSPPVGALKMVGDVGR